MKTKYFSRTAYTLFFSVCALCLAFHGTSASAEEGETVKKHDCAYYSYEGMVDGEPLYIKKAVDPHHKYNDPNGTSESEYECRPKGTPCTGMNNQRDNGASPTGVGSEGDGGGEIENSYICWEKFDVQQLPFFSVDHCKCYEKSEAEVITESGEVETVIDYVPCDE